MKIVMLLLTLSLSPHMACAGGANFIDHSSMTGDSALAALDNLSWVPDGPANEKHIYIISAPWCPACKGLYQKTRSMNEKVQFRWIMAGPDDKESVVKNKALAFSRDPAILKTVYEGGHVAEPKASAASIIDTGDVVALESLKKCFDKKAGIKTGFPKLIYATNGNWVVLSGIPSDMESILSGVAARPGSKNPSPDIAGLASGVKSVADVNGKNYYAKKNAFVYAYPSRNALRVVSLDAGTGLVGVKSLQMEKWSSWVYFQLYNNGMGGWADMSDFR